TYRARLFLVGSMNPEEGRLRPQMQDRFGLRVVVKALEDPAERLEAYRRSVAYQQVPHKMLAEWREETNQAGLDIQQARALLPDVTFAPGAEETGLRWVQTLQIESHRAEITMFEAARAYAAADGRDTATVDDLRVVAPMALRQRQSEFIADYVAQQSAGDQIIQEIIGQD
ncbi:MAG: magnesium chelatase, partial [Anaerolineae bacterium]